MAHILSKQSAQKTQCSTIIAIVITE